MQQIIVELPKPEKEVAVYSPQLPICEITEPPVPLPYATLREDREMSDEIGRPRRFILKALADYYYLTAEQLTRLLFSPTSYTYVNKHLRFLISKQYVGSLLPAKQLLYGRPPNVYYLTHDGWLLVKNLGFSVNPRFRSISESTHKPYTLSHILAVNEFLIKTVLLAKHHEDIVLRRTVHDKVLARNPLIAQLPQAEKPKRLIPDSWIDLGQKSIRQRSCYCVEQNLTQVRQSEWRETVRKYLYCLPSYEEQFGTNIITVLVSVQTGTDFPIKPLDKLTPTELEERQEEAKNRAHRRHLLQTWTEKEITSLNRLQDGDMFRFSSSPLDEITYRQLYFAPHWYIPFQQTPTALIPQNKEARS